MRRLTTPSHDPSAECGNPDATDACGLDPGFAEAPLDILVMHAGALRRPWLRVRIDPDTGIVLDAEFTAFR